MSKATKKTTPVTYRLEYDTGNVDIIREKLREESDDDLDYFEDLRTESESEEEEQAPRTKAKYTKSKLLDSDEEDEEVPTPCKKGKPPAKRLATKSKHLDSEEEEEEPAPKKIYRASMRAESSTEESDVDEDEDEVLETIKRYSGKKSAVKKAVKTKPDPEDIEEDLEEDRKIEETKKNEELRIATDLLISRMNSNPEVVESVILTLKLINPSFSAITSFVEEKEDILTGLQALFINHLIQEDFNDVLVKYGYQLSLECVRTLSEEKLVEWLKTIRVKKLILDKAYNLINVVVSKDLLPENSETEFLLNYMKSCPSNPTKIYLETLESILMMYDGRFEINFLEIKTKAIWQVIGKYLTNKNSMLKLECEAKARHIESMNSKSS
jgi:hypothetical protein